VRWDVAVISVFELLFRFCTSTIISRDNEHGIDRVPVASDFLLGEFVPNLYSILSTSCMSDLNSFRYHLLERNDAIRVVNQGLTFVPTFPSRTAIERGADLGFFF